MVRLALMLGTAIYAGLVIFSEPDPEATVDVARAASVSDMTGPAIAPSRDTLITADGRELPIAVIVDPAALDEDGAQIALISTRTPDTLTASASGGASETALVEVTGGFVNLRAGPSTDDAVLGAIAGGEQAELMDTLASGWVQIRVLSSGVEGYMSDSFVAPVN